MALCGSAAAADYAPFGQTVAPAATDWNGFYAGFSLGHGQGSAVLGNDAFLGFETGAATTGQIDLSGWFAGLQAGYNFSLGNGLVFGVQGDLEDRGATGSFAADDFITATDTLNWTGSVTGRLGYALDSILPYALGGVAFANNTITQDDLAADSGSKSASHVGFTAGAGIEAMFTPNLSGFVEARYTDYGTAFYGVGDDADPSLAGPISLTDTTVRTGLNYHF